MENASKALIIAGEILLAIILLTLFSYIFSLMSENTARIEKKEKLNQITQFNQEFLNYEGRGTKIIGTDSGGNPIYNNPLTIQDVATLINLANDNDNKYRFYTKVKIELKNGSSSYIINNTPNDNGIKWLNDNLGSMELYKCNSVKINSESLLVDKVQIEKINT